MRSTRESKICNGKHDRNKQSYLSLQEMKASGQAPARKDGHQMMLLQKYRQMIRCASLKVRCSEGRRYTEGVVCSKRLFYITLLIDSTMFASDRKL